MAAPYAHFSSADSGLAGTALAQSYASHQKRLIAVNVSSAAKVVLCTTLVYAAAEFIQSPARLRPQLGLYCFQLVIPLLVWWMAQSERQQRIALIALLADLSYSALLAGRLFLPTETTSGVALFLCLKMVATAVLFPWGLRFQSASAGLTVLLYWAFLSASGRTIEPAAAPHQWLGPLVAAVLSAAGAANAERIRRTLFLRGIKLAGSEAQLRSLLESVPDGILVIEAGRIAFANLPLVDMLGYESEDTLLGRSVLELAPPETQPILSTHIEQAIKVKGLRLDTRFTRADGNPLHVSLTFAALSDAATPAVQIMVRDITERKRAEDGAAVVLDVAKTISGTLELWEILDRVQRRVVEVLPCDAVATFYRDTDGEPFRIIADHGTPTHLLEYTAGLELRSGVPFVDRLLSMRTVVINDPADQPWIPPEWLSAAGISAALWTQLLVRGRPVGALVAINTTKDRRFDPGQVGLFEGIARQVGMAIEATELYQAAQQEAEVSAALARVGRELISSLDQPVLLERLCQLTTEVLECDGSHTVLFDPDAQESVVVSAYGYAPEQWESIRILKTPRALLSPWLEALERDDVTQFTVADATGAPLAGVARQLGLTAVLYIALRCGDELIGIHVVGSRQRQRFTPQQERIGRGIAQLASLALQNARLVDELARASRLKSEFLATMSHELRTPLNIVIGYNDLLLEGLFGTLTPEQAETLQRMAKSERELLELITATLDVSRLESGRMPLERRDVDVAVLLHEIDTETRELQERRGLQVMWNVAPALPRLVTDPLKLKVILKNLILNAIKFTDEGRVTIDAHASGTALEFTVCDTGIGMSPEELTIVFEPFRQADSSSTRRHGGVGLGLYIVRRLLDVLGGTVAVESEVGRGSTFRVSVPGLTEGDSPSNCQGEAA